MGPNSPWLSLSFSQTRQRGDRGHRAADGDLTPAGSGRCMKAAQPPAGDPALAVAGLLSLPSCSASELRLNKGSVSSAGCVSVCLRPRHAARHVQRKSSTHVPGECTVRSSRDERAPHRQCLFKRPRADVPWVSGGLRQGHSRHQGQLTRLGHTTGELGQLGPFPAAPDSSSFPPRLFLSL